MKQTPDWSAFLQSLNLYSQEYKEVWIRFGTWTFEIWIVDPNRDDALHWEFDPNQTMFQQMGDIIANAFFDAGYFNE